MVYAWWRKYQREHAFFNSGKGTDHTCLKTLQAVHRLLLQCLDFLTALLVVLLKPLPAKLVGNRPVGNYITYCPKQLRLDSFVH